MNTTKLVTRESLTTLIREAEPLKQMHIVGRALSILLDHQTLSEQNSLSTQEFNGVGFTGADAEFGTICANYYNQHKRLSIKQVAPWIKLSKSGTPRIAKYHAQLNRAAMKKKLDPK